MKIDPMCKEKTPMDLKELAADPSYAHPVQHRMSRAKRLFRKKGSLRDAFLLKEIIDRP